MYRIDDSSAATVLPTPEAAGVEGFWTEGNPVLNIPATLERASWFNMVQEELRNVVLAGGQTPSKTTYNQLLLAIQNLIEVRAGNYVLDTGVANAYVVALSPAVTTYTNGLVARVKIVNANSGASTLNAGGGVVPLVNDVGGALVLGDLPAGSVFTAVYDSASAKFMITSLVPSQAITQTQADARYLQLAGGSLTGAVNEAQGANVASAATVNLTAMTGNYGHITGVTGITAITLQQGAERTMVFDGILTLTNGASLILPGGMNITTAAGAVAVFRGEAAGVVRCTNYLPPQVQVNSTMPAAFKNLKIVASGLTNTSAVVTADKITLEDGSGNYFGAENVNLTINSATAGANSLDTGISAASTWYSVWVIYNPSTNTTAGLLSTSATAPTLPTGYTYQARVGWVRTDASVNKYLLQTVQYGRDARYVVLASSNTPNLPSMASGVAGSVTVPTWVSVATGAFVPPTASAIAVSGSTASNGTLMVAPSNAYGAFNSTTNPPPLVATGAGSTSAALAYLFGELILETANIYWAAATGCYLFAYGWRDNI